MSRALLNNPTLAKTIKQNFIPFAGSIERLQPSRYGGKETPASRWFQKSARAAFDKFAPPGWWEQFKTYQGFYVLKPDGTPIFYKVVWKLQPAEVTSELKRVGRVYQKSPQTKLNGAKSLKGAKPLTAPGGTSLLRVYSRIKPVPKGAPVSNKGIGLDHMWVLKGEVQAMDKAASKTGFTLPESVVARLVRFQLVDNVRNVSPGFDPKDVKKAEFRAKLLKAEKGRKTISFEGRYDSRGKSGSGVAFGVKGSLRGRLTIDSAQAKIVKMRAYGKATCTGTATEEAPRKPYPIHFALVEAYDSVGRSVPPTWYGLSPMFRHLYLKPSLGE